MKPCTRPFNEASLTRKTRFSQWFWWKKWYFLSCIFSHAFQSDFLSNDHVLMCQKQCQSHLYPVTTMWHRSPSSSCVVCFSPLHKGAFTNYVDNILPIIDHLPTPDDIFEGITCTIIGESLHAVDISSTTCLPRLVCNVLYEWPSSSSPARS